MNDLIKRKDAIKAEADRVYKVLHPIGCKESYEDCLRDAVKTFKDIPSAEPKQGEWIPIMWHEITDEEREEEDYPEDWTVFIDSEMPADGEQILVTTKRGEVERDTCLEDNGFYLDSGWDWIDDIVAWMPLPEPWKGATND